MASELSRERVAREDFSHEDVIALFERVEALQNDLSDALEVKVGRGPTVLSDMKRQIDTLTAKLESCEQERDQWKDKHEYLDYFFNSAITERNELRVAKQSLIDTKKALQRQLQQREETIKALEGGMMHDQLVSQQQTIARLEGALKDRSIKFLAVVDWLADQGWRTFYYDDTTALEGIIDLTDTFNPGTHPDIEKLREEMKKEGWPSGKAPGLSPGDAGNGDGGSIPPPSATREKGEG